MDIGCLNVITIAYLGDAVYELYVRENLVQKGIYKTNDIQKEATKYVSAKGQVKFLNYLIDNNLLNDKEIEIVKRGRNYNRNSHPKNTDIITYKFSTGFETLIGTLYLNNKERLNEILDYLFKIDI